MIERHPINDILLEDQEINLTLQQLNFTQQELAEFIFATVGRLPARFENISIVWDIKAHERRVSFVIGQTIVTVKIGGEPITHPEVDALYDNGVLGLAINEVKGVLAKKLEEVYRNNISSLWIR